MLSLPTRVNAPLPIVELIDVRQEKLQHGLSQRMLAELASALTQGEQALLFINRRGYAPILLCKACEWVATCPRCSVKLVLHLRDGQLRCHHCGHEEPVAKSCSGCGNQDLVMLGQGTQRVEETLNSRFPNARILRIDGDTTRKKFAWRTMRDDIHEHRADILVGTQMLAKGHDFPKLNLVGVINADRSLYSADFRAEERLFAQLAQVAGRAGRGKIQGKVFIQTEFLDHPLYRALQAHNFSAFAESSLQERHRAKFPPFVHQALLRAEGPKLETAMSFLEKAKKIAENLNATVTIYGPVEATLRRFAGHERAQILIQSGSRNTLQSFLEQWIDALSDLRSHKTRWAIDVDPLEF
jgi:primosomal protein N' (replication factor Y)